MKQVKETRKKFKQEDVFDIGVKAKKVWEEVWDDTQTYCFRGEPRGRYREGGGGGLLHPLALSNWSNIQTKKQKCVVFPIS